MQGNLALRIEGHDARTCHAARPAKLFEPVEQGAAQCAGQMVTPLAPVQAGAANGPPRARQCSGIDAQLADQWANVVDARLPVPAPAKQPLLARFMKTGWVGKSVPVAG